jgi:hypothetical protein
MNSVRVDCAAGAPRKTWFDEQLITLQEGLNLRAVRGGRIQARMFVNNISGHI